MGELEMAERPLTKSELRAALPPYLPAGRMGTSTFSQLLPLIPFVVLPGGRRRYYFLQDALDAIRQFLGNARQFPAVQPRPDSALHRRRPRRTP